MGAEELTTLGKRSFWKRDSNLLPYGTLSKTRV